MLNIQHKLTRIRPPRVKITYDLETEGSSKKLELPFVIGVMGNYSGDNNDTNNADSEFTLVDTDNIDQYINHINPKLSYTVKNVIDNTKFLVNLNFKSREDFDIHRLITEIPELSSLYEKIKVLNEILVMVDTNENIQNLLEEIFMSNEKNTLLNELKSSLERAIKEKKLS